MPRFFPVTPLQRAVLDFILARIAATGCAPTHQAIADHFGWPHPSNATYYILALKRKGLLRCEGRRLWPVGALVERSRAVRHVTDHSVSTRSASRPWSRSPADSCTSR